VPRQSKARNDTRFIAPAEIDPQAGIRAQGLRALICPLGGGETVDPGGATGRLILNVFAAFARFEREKMLERQREEFGRLLYGQLGRFGPLENFIHIRGCLPGQIGQISAALGTPVTRDCGCP
jgi:hypothetical protein